MKKDETWKYALREIKRRKGRTISNVFGYMIAVATLLILISWLSYAKESFVEKLRDVGAHFIAFMPSDELCCPAGTIDTTEGLVAAGSNSILFDASLIDQLNKFPSVLEASPYLSFRFRDSRYGHNFIVGGFDPTKRISFGATLCAPGDLTSGRFLVDGDRQVAMAERVYADVRGLKVGDSMIIGNEYFELIGIVSPAVRPARADLYLHIADAARVIGNYISSPINYRQSVNVALVETTDAGYFTQALRDAESLGFETFGFACAIPAASAMGMNEQSMVVLMIIIALGTLIFSGKTQHASIVERQHDIGILKAIGWSNRRIVKQVITESVVQAFMGSILGVVLALIVIYVLPLKALSGIDAGIDFHITWYLIPAALLLSVIGGVISGMFPAWSSANKNPADALRYV